MITADNKYLLYGLRLNLPIGVFKFDPDGSLIYEKTVNMQNIDLQENHFVYINEHLLVTNNTLGGNYGILLVDQDGNTVSKTIALKKGEIGQVRMIAINSEKEKEYIVLVCKDEIIRFDHNGYLQCTYKIDSKYTEMNVFGSSEKNVFLDKSKNLYYFTRDVILKYDNEGKLLNKRMFFRPSVGYDFFIQSIFESKDGHLYFTGYEIKAPGELVSESIQKLQKEITVKVNGKAFLSEFSPMIIGGVVHMNATDIAKIFNCGFSYKDKNLLLTKGNRKLSNLGKTGSNVYLNGKLINSPTLYYKQDFAVMPVRTAVEAFGGKFSFDEKSKILSIELGK